MNAAPKMKPWAIGPFELIRHAEGHRKDGTDFDRRMALISYDNAIESSISTFIKLNPAQRSGISFPKTQAENWLVSFHSKLDFLKHYIVDVLKQPLAIDTGDAIYYHGLRNNLYHDGNGFAPALEHIEGIREIALGVFESLFSIKVEKFLETGNGEQIVEIKGTAKVFSENKISEDVNQIRKDLEQLKQYVAAPHKPIQSDPTDKEVLESLLGQKPEINDLVAALGKGKEISDSLAKEQLVPVTNEELKEVQELLHELKSQVKASLRAHQASLAEAALKATLTAVSSGKRTIGAIYQTTGSGLSMTVAAFVTMVSRHASLREFTVIVASNRLVFVEQLNKRIVDVSNMVAGRPVMWPEGASLSDAIKRQPHSIVMTTVQGLAFAKAQTELPQKLLVVGVDVRPSEVLYLPNSFAIYFTSGQPIDGLEIIGEYSSQRAIEDGYANPVKFESRNVLARRFSSLEEITEETFGPALRMDEMEILVQDIIEHFQKQRLVFLGKALVIVESIETAERMVQELRRVTSNTAEQTLPFADALTSNLAPSDAAALVRRFQSDSPDLLFLVCAKMWAGLDLQNLQCVYITCRVSRNELEQLAGRLSRIVPGKPLGILVDYARNALG